MKYVALLRGINVGGNHKVPMVELRTLFETLDFREVSTYINSGNVIFSSLQQPDVADIYEQFERQFGFRCDVLVLSAVKVISVAEAIPGEWVNDAEQKTDVLYLFPDVDKPDILAHIGHKPEIENMLSVPGAVIVNVSRQNQSKGSLLKMMGTPLYKRMTIRNATTARKLAELVQ